jgi:hypothetical protein
MGTGRATVDTTVVTLRVTVDHPPSGPGVHFGLQDRSGRILGGVPTPPGGVTFEAEVRVTLQPGTGAPNFLGPFTHGSPANRHLYLSQAKPGEDGWAKRIKLPLASISREMIEAARNGGTLEATVDGRSAATVPGTWRVV